MNVEFIKIASEDNYSENITDPLPMEKLSSKVVLDTCNCEFSDTYIMASLALFWEIIEFSI